MPVFNTYSRRKRRAEQGEPDLGAAIGAGVAAGLRGAGTGP